MDERITIEPGKRRAAVVLCAMLGLLVILGTAGRFFHHGSRSACSNGELCAEVQRPYYPVRHWQWSGIFPAEGGFIPDPHFSVSTSLELSEPVRQLLHAPDARFQIIDVNAGFNDETSEIVLVIRAGGNTYQYQLGFPKGEHVVAVLGTPMPPAVRAFAYRDKDALIANFVGPAKGAYFLDVPLRHEGPLVLIPAKSAEFEGIASELRAVSNDASTKHQFCQLDNEFAALFEKFVGSCGWTAAEYQANPGVRDYASFWLKD